MQVIRHATPMVALLLTAGCFSSVARKRIAGEYCLEEWPRGYVVSGCSFRAKLHGTTDNGPMDGMVRRIGWNERLIVAQRAAVSGGTLAWMIVDTKTETLEGPFTDEEFKEKVKATAELAAIKIDSAASAWEAIQ